MHFQVLVDAEEFWPALERDIALAREHVYVQTLSFEGDRVGKALSMSLMDSTAPDRRVIADEFYAKHRINDRLLSNPRNWFNKEIRAERDETSRMIDHLAAEGVRVKLTNPSGPLHVWAMSRNHKKIIVIDNRISYVGGMNFSDHNFEWHDMMVRIENGTLARFLADDFTSSWADQHSSGARQFEGIELHRLDANNNRRSLEPILSRIAGATRSVDVVSPYITYPFWEALRNAKRNGAKITLITPDKNNWGALKEYVMWESNRAGLDVRLYPQRMMHMKAILIDDDELVVGSSNFDFLSYRFMQEIVAVIVDHEAIEQFKAKVLGPDLEQSFSADTHVPLWKGYYHLARFKVLSLLAGIVHPLQPGRR